jgi:hypothetical protein
VTGSKVLDIILKGCFLKAVDLEVESFHCKSEQAGRGAVEQHHGIKIGLHS